MKLSVSGCLRRSVYAAFAAGIASIAAPVLAQDAPAAGAAPASDGKAVKLEAVKVTGSRIQIPGATSASPIVTVRAEEFSLQQTPEVEQVLRNLPSTLPSDGANANNGSAGAATLNLRGLGSQRNLILIDGKRVTPYNVNGLVDTSVISTALLDRVDIVTGGASAVYGSDAMSGAVNFIMKKNFQGVEVKYTNGLTGEGDGDKTAISMAMGTNLAGGKGNLAMSLNYAHRDGVQLGQRPLGQLGIVTEDGTGLSNFRAGRAPTPAPAGCGGPGSVVAGGSTTTLPTRLALFGVTNPGAGFQFREDGTLQGNCSVFNFNPFNYYETPQERYGGAVYGRFEFNEHAEAYSRLLYSGTSVRQQVAPSGVFGNSFFTPLANPFISSQARTTIINHAEAARLRDPDGTGPRTSSLSTDPNGTAPYNWQDRNGNGVVDAPDYLNLTYRRRTVEFGERSTTYNNAAYQFLVGTRGNIIGNWDYDVSYQRGQSDRTNISAGYTNVANIANAVDARSDGAGNIVCTNAGSTAPGCVPINLFGGFGAITPAMAAYSSATALEYQTYVQHITNATVNGSVNFPRPFASRPLGLSFGIESRRESGGTTPDECLKLAPASCLGGAGGNTLPISAGFHVKELFTEAILPLIDGKFLAKSLDLELGYRWSDYDPTGLNRTWKYGLSWTPVDGVLARIMRQRAARAPNVGELGSPTTAALSNAQVDPCSRGNKDLNQDGIPDADQGGPRPPSDALVNRCLSTGVASRSDVGTLEDLVSGQVNAFAGTDLANPPKPESADTTTIGVVWQPKNFGFIRNAYLSLDYYDIKVNDYIGTFGSQELLNACYSGGQANACSKIIRVGNTLTNPGSGIQLFTTNLKYLQAEGVEMVGSFAIRTSGFGSFRFAANANYYLTQESQSSSVNNVIDCKGFYGTQCGNPLPEFRFTQRTTWDFKDVELSYFWRYLGGAKVETAQITDGNTVFPEFQSIDSFNYLDLSVGYNVTKKVKVSFLAQNVFDQQPPVVGNEAADTRSNSGNTFPSVYDVLGRVYSLGVSASF